MKGVKQFSRTPAPCWKRFFAYLLDMILINLITVVPFKSSLEQYSQYSISFGTTGDSKVIAISVLIVLLTLFYYVILEYRLRQTFGKMLFKIQVASKEKGLTLQQVFIRNVTKPFPILLFVDTLYMFFKKTNQRLFEKFSNTEVVETPWKI